MQRPGDKRTTCGTAQYRQNTVEGRDMLESMTRDKRGKNQLDWEGHADSSILRTGNYW